MTRNRFDIAIVGGGPAGTATAILLARCGFSVLVLESTHYQRNLAGQALPPTIARRLRQLDVFDTFVRQRQRPADGIISVWGNRKPQVNDFLFGVHGSGWHVDRNTFDTMLAQRATAAGATVWTDSRLLTRPLWNRRKWIFDAIHHATESRCTCRFLIDATGRSGSPWLADLSQRIVLDRLIGISWTGPNNEEFPYSLVESAEFGWFYSASLPGKRATIVYLTDSDLFRQTARSCSNIWWRELCRTAYTCNRYPIGVCPTNVTVCSAATTVRANPAGKSWCAVGDAALSYDPLSGLGVQQAIDSGLCAASAVKRYFEHGEALDGYRRWVDHTFQVYLTARQRYYSAETRWLDSPFWQRRLRFTSDRAS